MAKLRANANKEIARSATELVIKWKKLVEQEKNSKLQKAKMGSPAPAAAGSSPAAAAVAGGAKKAFTGDPDKRRFDSDGVDNKRTDSNVRNQCIGLVYNGLAYRCTEAASDVIAKSVAVEQAVFDVYKGETADYKKKIRSLFMNLKTKSNKELGPRVMSGAIPPEKFAVMTDEDLKSDDQRKKDMELEEENMKKAQVPMAEKSISDSLECGRCKKKQVSYTQAQTRSADEPMTTFCECMNCGLRWKVGATTSPPAENSRLTPSAVLVDPKRWGRGRRFVSQYHGGDFIVGRDMSRGRIGTGVWACFLIPFLPLAPFAVRFDLSQDRRALRALPIDAPHEVVAGPSMDYLDRDWAFKCRTILWHTGFGGVET